jgi:hypothetical protein
MNWIRRLPAQDGSRRKVCIVTVIQPNDGSKDVFVHIGAVERINASISGHRECL